MHAEVPAMAYRSAVVSVEAASKTLTFGFESVLALSLSGERQIPWI